MIILNFLKHLFSINEMKASALILSLLIAMGMILFSWVHTGDIPNVLVNLTEALAYSVAGVNVVGGVKKMISPTTKPEKELKEEQPKG